MEKFTYFWQSQSPFSQWHYSPFKVGELSFTCCEQWMMYHKALMMGDDETAKQILNAGYNPKLHKALGRKVKPFDEALWKEKCRDLVFAGNYYKFVQNPHLLLKLKETKGTTLVEASPYDTIWGIGLNAEDPRAKNRNTWRGTNWLGEAITKLRITLIGE